MNQRHQQGFTLVELIITVVIFGILIIATGPAISSALTMMEAAKRDEVIVNNQKLAGAMMGYARNSNSGRLPAPYTGNGIASGLYNPADTSTTGQALAMELRNTGVPVNNINSDAAVIENAKVYQRVSGLTYQVPLYFTSGTAVTLTYDVGAITQTACAKGNACNTGVPGESDALTAANVTTWEPKYPDFGAVVFSTLPEQKNMLRQTVGRINRLSDRLASEFYTRMRVAAANSTQNFYPAPTNAGAPNLAGINPVSNMGCHDGWYRLNASNVNILTQIGLDANEYGVTAWGGSIDYCRDYEPTAVSSASANNPPHYAALRFNRNLSAGSVSSGTVSNDVVITF